MLGRAALFLLVAVAVAVPSVSAVNTAVSGGEYGVATNCADDINIIKVAGVVNAGTVTFCDHYFPRIPTNQVGFIVTADVRSPDTPAGLVTTYTYLMGNLMGCSKNGGGALGPGQQVDSIGAFASSSWALWNMTFNTGSNYCFGQIGVTVAVGGALTVAHPFASFAVVRDIREVENMNRNCGNSAFVETFANTVQSSTPADCPAQTLNVVNSGSLTLSGTLNSILSGTVTLAGGLTVTDDAGGWAIHQDAITGSLTLSGNLATTVTGGLTITDDANGWAVHQDALTGAITVNGVPDTQAETQAIADAILTLQNLAVDIVDDTTPDGMLTVPAAMVDGNVSNNFTFPTNLNATLNGGSMPLQVSNAQGEFFAPILLWGVALFVMLRFRKLLSAGVCSLGLIIAVFALGLPIHALALAGLLVALWLEATAKDKIITAFFTGETTNP